MNNEQFIAAALERVTLPDGYSWGPWDGTYRVVQRANGAKVCRVGGVSVLVDSNAQPHVDYQIARGERELLRSAL